MIIIKPHHFVDIITSFGAGDSFSPHPYGHAVHAVAREILGDMDVEIKIELGADDICRPCIHNIDGLCDDIIDVSDRPLAPVSKREWNLLIDNRWSPFLGIKQGDVLTGAELCRRINGRLDRMPDIYREESLEKTARRQYNLKRGLYKLAGFLPAGERTTEMNGKVREKLWMWGHEAGMQNARWGLQGKSQITPADACRYMNIENLLMVRENGKPEPPYEPHMESFKSLKKVIWSLVGAAATFEEGELERIIALKKKYPNLAGAMMDDFFTREDGAVFNPATIRKIRKTLHFNDLELWVVLYSHQLDTRFSPHMRECDVATFWTWQAKNLDRLEENFDRFVRLAPSGRRMLGCYMWDYGDSQPLPVPLMEKQCSLGLRWLREGKIDGIIFLATCICDLKLETVEWTRGWIKTVENEPVCAKMGK